MKERLLIVDDEVSIRFGVRDYFETLGVTVFEAESIKAAKRLLETESVTCIVADYQLGDGSALELLAYVRATQPATPVIVLTAHASLDLAVRAMKEGAENFVPKPVVMEALQIAIAKASSVRKAQRKILAATKIRGKQSFDPFVGTSVAVQKMRAAAELALRSEIPVLLLGETGSGKGVLAAWLHANGSRSDAPFVDLNCATLSREFLETELFGHEKGAFTGAAAEKKGLFEIADEGTLFLDEIGDVDPAVQPKLLKVIEEKRFRRLGGVREQVVDVRLIAATSHDLPKLVQDKRFRSDLYFRISAFPIRVPSLAERKEDIPELALSMLEQLWGPRGERLIDAGAVAKLQAHRWPGNLRELRNALERATLRAQSDRITADDLLLESPAGVESSPDLRSLAEVEAEHIRRVYLAEGQHVERAAVRLGISRSSLYTKLKALGLLPLR